MFTEVETAAISVRKKMISVATIIELLLFILVSPLSLQVPKNKAK